MNNPYLQFLIVVGFLLVLSLVVVSILRYTSRWNRLESFYHAASAIGVTDFGLQWINIASPVDPWGGFNRFGWIISVGANRDGVFFHLIFPFRWILRPILIPWTDLVLADERYVGTTRHELIPGRVPEVQFILPGGLTEKLRTYHSKI